MSFPQFPGKLYEIEMKEIKLNQIWEMQRKFSRISEDVSHSKLPQKVVGERTVHKLNFWKRIWTVLLFFGAWNGNCRNIISGRFLIIIKSTHKNQQLCGQTKQIEINQMPVNNVITIQMFDFYEPFNELIKLHKK